MRTNLNDLLCLIMDTTGRLEAKSNVCGSSALTLYYQSHLFIQEGVSAFIALVLRTKLEK